MADASLAGLLLRLVVSMGVVIGLMLLAARVLRRSGTRFGIGGRGQRRAPISVQAIQPLTRGANVAVVRAGGRELVLGVTDQQITLLHSAIEPRGEVGELDGDAPAALTDDTVTDARIANVTADDRSDTELVSHMSAWTDALELLREKTVRR